MHGFRGDRVFAAVAKDAVKSGPNAVVRAMEWYGRQWTLSSNLSITCDPGPPVRCTGNARPEDHPFEITPRYLSDLRVPYNMMQQLPHAKQVKLVAILRHPTPRAWSAFFQTARPPMWKRQTFVDHAREEVRLVRKCYNSSLAFSLLAAEIPGHRPMRLDAAHVRQTSCREPITAYVAFQRCVQAHVRDQEEPWFLKYTQAYAEMPRKFGVMEEAPFQGNVVRGFYVDHLINYLCAGFEPQDMLILTQGRCGGVGVWGGGAGGGEREESPDWRRVMAARPLFPAELRDNATSVAERVAQHAGVDFVMETEKWFKQGVSKQHKSVGPIPAEVVPLLNELYAPYNDMLLKLILSNPFVANKGALVHELSTPYTPPPAMSDDELRQLDEEMNAAADAAALKQEEREAAQKNQVKAELNKPPKGRKIPGLPDI